LVLTAGAIQATTLLQKTLQLGGPVLGIAEGTSHLLLQFATALVTSVTAK